MKPIEVFVDAHFTEDLRDSGFSRDIVSIVEGDSTFPVTILPGHLADQLRWRKVGEERPEGGKLYAVDGLGACYARSNDCGEWFWVGKKFNDWNHLGDHDTYRPAIAGLDYVEGV